MADPKGPGSTAPSRKGSASEPVAGPPAAATAPAPAPPAAGAAGPGSEKFPYINDTQEKEDQFDLVAARNLPKPTGLFGTIAYIIKGALGAGILSAHAGFANAGLVAVPLAIVLSIYMGYCLTVLCTSAQLIYKRTEITKMTYSDLGEACFALSRSSKVRKMSKPFRYFIDGVVIIDLFGACCCYQLMIAGTIKQIVENQQRTSIKGLSAGYPNLRIYLLMIALPMIAISLIRRLDLLAKVSIVGNVFVVMCVIATVYYSVKTNPSMTGMRTFTNAQGLFTFIGMVSFSMSCSGIVVSLECNMKEPYKWPIAMGIGMGCIFLCVSTLALFGYSAYGEHCKTPITFHFPMETFPIILKVSIAIMLFITHGVNFWVPFNMIFHYIQRCHKKERLNCWENIYRVIFCFFCTLLGIVFPSVNKLMSFIGAFCIINMAFIFPAIIWVVTHWDRPGLGKGKWKLIVAGMIVFFGIIIFAAGTVVSIKGLVEIFTSSDEKIDMLDSAIVGEEYYDDYYYEYYYDENKTEGVVNNTL